MSDFIPNKLGFDFSGCVDYIKKIMNVHLDMLSQELIKIVVREIWNNGNGSRVMRLDACANVKETKREITNDHVSLEVGIDMDKLKSKGEDLFVRVAVVLHGNMNGSQWTWRDAQMMYTKPGVETYGKNVTNKRVHVPKGATPRAMPGFAQQDVMPNIVYGIEHNSEKEIQKYIQNYMDCVDRDILRMNWSAFITGG